MGDEVVTPKPKTTRSRPLNQTVRNASGANQVVVQALPKGKRNDFITVYDVQHGQCHIPLGQGIVTCSKDTHKDYAKGQNPNALVAFIPLVYTSPARTRVEVDLPEPGNWIYVFRNGKLWREVSVTGEAAFSDVNLMALRKETKDGTFPDVRNATGIAEQCIIVPSKVGGATQAIEIAVSHVQWSGSQIKVFESDAAKRARRMQKLDFSGYATSFRGNQGVLGSIDEVQSNSQLAVLDHLKGSGMAVGYLNDPIYIAKRLKQEHATAVNAIEITSERMRLSDYGLAVVVQQLLEAEEKGVEADPEVAKARNLPKVYEREQLRKDQEYSLKIRHYKERAEIIVQEKSKLAAAVDATRLKQRLDYWEHLDRETNEAAYNTGQKLLSYLKDTSAPVTVEEALGDYLENIGPRAAGGAALWCGLVEELAFKEALDYLKETAEQRNTIGKSLCTPHSDVVKAARNLERSAPNTALLKSPAAALTQGERIKLIKTSAGVVSHLLKTFGMVKLEEGKAGMEWLAKLMNRYLPLEVRVERTSIALMYGLTKTTAGRGFRFLPTMGDIYDRIQVDYLKIKEIKNWGELAKAVQDSEVVKHYSFAVGIIGMFNYAQTTKALWFDKHATDQESLESIAGLGEQAAFVAKISKFCFERAVKGWAEAAEVANDKTRKEFSYHQERKGSVPLNGPYDGERVTRHLAQEGTVTLRRRIIYAANTGSVLDVVTAVMGLSTGGYEFYNQFRDRSASGMTGAGLKIASSSITLTNAVRSFKWLRVARVVEGAGVAAKAGGVATSELGVGILILAIGVVLDIRGSHLLRQVSKSELEKALYFGHFGRRRYQEGYFTQRHNMVTAVQDMPLVQPFTEPKVDDQLYEIYRCLYAFDGNVDLAQEVNGKAPLTGRKVVRGVVEFAQFLPYRSLLDCHIELHDRSGGLQTLSCPEQLKAIPVVKEGQLRGLKFFGRLTDERVAQLSHVVMKLRFDALGDGKYVIPNDENSPFQRSEFWMHVLDKGFVFWRPNSHRYRGGPKDGEVLSEWPTQSTIEVEQAYQCH